MDTFAELDERIGRLCSRASSGEAGPGLAEEMDATLSEGYARALMMERDLVELDERLVDIMLAGDDRRAAEMALVDARRRAIGRRTERLREQLTRMHDSFLVIAGR